MIHAINHPIRTTFFEGTGQTGCLKKLQDLVTSIQNAIVRLFEYLLPCFFSKKTTPTIDPQKVGTTAVPPVTTALPNGTQKPIPLHVIPTQLQQALPIPMNVQIVLQPPPVQQQPLPVQHPQPPPPQQLPVQEEQQQEPVQQQQLPVQEEQQQVPVQQQQLPVQEEQQEVPGQQQQLPVQQQQQQEPVQEEQLPAQEPPVANGLDQSNEVVAAPRNIHDHDPNERKESELTEMVREMWKLSLRSRNAILDQIDPKGAAKLPSLSDVTGSKSLSEEQVRASIFVVIESLDILWDQIAERTQFTGATLDQIFDRGLDTFGDIAKNMPADQPVPYLDICQSYDSLKPLPLLQNRRAKDPMSFDATLPADQFLQILQNAARNRALVGSVFIAKEPPNNPATYGVFVQFNNQTGATDFYVVNPYGANGNKSLSFKKFNQLGEANRFLRHPSGYRCIAFERAEVGAADLD